MSSLQDSIVLITNDEVDEGIFGTGFVIYHDEQATYVLTCAHVVNAMSDTKKFMVDGATASTFVWGAEDGADLAVLRVEGLQDKPVLRLSTAGKIGDKFTAVGFQSFETYGHKTAFMPVPLHGTLGEQTRVGPSNLSTRIDAWFLKIVGDSKLEEGYSGSPVIDDVSGKVIGIVSTRVGPMRGVAIAIKALQEIWPGKSPSLFQEAELGTIYTSLNEAGSTEREVQIHGSTAELLTQEEQEMLIALLCELPNIDYANVRHSLVSTLPAQFQSYNDFDKPLEDHITEIVDMVISDAQLKLPNGSYPLTVLIQNALNMAKGSQLRDKLQLLLKNLNDRLGVVPQINVAPTLLDGFSQYLENFILQMPALEYELRSISDAFNNYDIQPDCATMSAHLTEVCAPFLDFAILLMQSKDLKVASHRILIKNALLDFNSQAKVVENNIDRFCEIFESVLEQDLPEEEWLRIQNQLNNLMEFCSSVLEAAEKLCNVLR